MKPIMESSFVLLDVDFQTKEEVVSAISEQFYKAGRLNSKTKYIDDVMKRENSISTAIGFFIATPHAKTNAVDDTCVGFARLKRPILWDNEENVRFVFQLAVSGKDCGDRHLQILADLSRKLIHEDFRASLDKITDEQMLVDLIGMI